MKKLIIAAAIAMAAVVSQAAVINWTTGTLFYPGEGGNGYAPMVEPTYGIVEPGAAGFLATLYVGSSLNADGSIANPFALTGNTGTTVGELSSISGTTADSADVVAGNTYYAQMIVTYGDSTLTSQVVKMPTSSITGSGDPMFGDGGGGIDPLDGNSFDEIYGAFPTTGWVASAEPTPEPTSGLLLLLGVAGLALRRKQK